MIHFEIPGSVEAYYQEAGRAGRDGELSACELLFNHADLKTQEFFFEGSNPSVDLIRSVYNLLRARCNPDTGELILGDIVISVDKVIEQAEKYNYIVENDVLSDCVDEISAIMASVVNMRNKVYTLLEEAKERK